jgi:hypothetical protein
VLLVKKTILFLTALLPVLMLFSPAVQAEQACVHEYGEWVLTLAPTCMEKGEVTRTCTLCNEVQTATVAQGAHKESDWTLAAAPEIGVAGSMQKLCTVCGEILATEELAALPDPETAAPQTQEPPTGAEEDPWIEISLPVAIGICLLPNLILLIVLLIRRIRHKIASKYLD